MPRKYTSEQFWQLYEKLPQELKEAISSEETAEAIFNICQKNEILDHLERVVELVGEVLIGILPPDEFQKTLEKELKFETDLAKKVTYEINRFIFFPVKEVLSKLYEIEIAPPARPPGVIPEIKPKIPPEEKRPDIYREPIE